VTLVFDILRNLGYGYRICILFSIIWVSRNLGLVINVAVVSMPTLVINKLNVLIVYYTGIAE